MKTTHILLVALTARVLSLASISARGEVCVK
jgi:hypothetical protein